MIRTQPPTGRRLWVPLMLLFFTACSSEVSVRDNAYDPQSIAPAQGLVQGLVVSDQQGILTPVAAAQVALIDGTLEVATVDTDADGRFTLASVAPGSHALRINATGFVPSVLGHLEVAPGESVDVGLVELTTQLSAGQPSLLTGVVTLEGQTLHGGTLVRTVDPPFQTVTLENGSFSMQLSEGSYDLAFSHDGFANTVRSGVALAKNSTLTLDPVVLTAQPATLSGTVRARACEIDGSPETTLPAGDATVTVLGTGVTGATDSNGDFSMTDLPSGIYRVRVSQSGFDSVEVAGVSLLGGQLTSLDAPILLEGSRGGVTGFIDLVGTTNDSGATIELTGTVFTGTSTSGGRFLINAACAYPGQEVRATREGYLSNSAAGVEVLSNQIVDVGTIKLARSQGGLSLGDGSGFTASLSVSAHLEAPTGTTEMRIADGDPDLFSNTNRATEGWKAYTLDSPVSLVPPLTGSLEGTHTVQAQTRIGTIPGSVLSAAVVLDTSKPTNPSAIIEAGSGYSKDPDGAVLINLSASELPGTGIDRVAGLAQVKLINVDVQACTTPPCAPTQAQWDATTPLPFMQVLDHPLLRPATDEAKETWARFSDRAGNWSDAASAQVILDRQAPDTLVLQIEGNAVWTSQAIVQLTLGASDANPGLSMRLSNSTSFLGSPWQPLAGGLTWFLPSGEGTQTVYAEFQDLAGNISGVISDSIELDTLPPTGTALSIVQAPYSAVQTVDLTLSANGAAEMAFSSTPDFGSPIPWISYTTSHSFTLLNTALDQRVYALFKDAAGNRSARLEANIVFDNTPPKVDRASLVEGGIVASPNVNLEVLAQAGPTEAFEERIDVTDLGSSLTTTGAWGPFNLIAPLTLPAPTGNKRLDLQLRDAAGNVSALTTISVTWDNTAPQVTAFSLAGGAAYTNNATVSASITATGASQLRLSERADFADTRWRGFGASLPILLSPGDGPKTLYLELRDAAANTSSSSASITLDSSPPTPVSVTLDGGAAASTDGVVDLLLTGLDSGSGISQALVSNDAAFGSASVVTWSGSGSETLSGWSLLPGEGMREVHVRFDDLAGNFQDTSAQILVDTIPPGGQLLIDANADTLSDTYTQSATVTLLLLTDTPAVEMAISNTALTCISASYVPFVAAPAWVLSAGDGPKTVRACVRDAAGNTTILSTPIVLDSTPPTASLSIDADGDSVGGDPWSVNTQVRLLMTAPADTHQVALVNAASLSCATASYEVFASPREWLLALGDGSKNVSACFRDDAGNTSLVSASILLDTTPPSTPDLVRSNISDTCIDLAWTASPDADLAGYVLERQIDGALGFSTLNSPAPGTTAYTDAWCNACDRSQCVAAVTAAHLGFGHAYRIHAIDSHGLVSPNSAVVRAGTPHAPPTSLYVTLKSDRHLEWTHPVGVSLTLGTYRYEDAAGTRLDAPVPVNASRFGLPANMPTDRLNEAVVLQTTNGDGSLTWSSRFELGHLREELVSSGATSLVGMDLDSGGVLHVAYVSSGNIIYFKNDGISVPSTVYTGSVGGKDLALKVDATGTAHLAFYETGTRQLTYLRLDTTPTPQIIDASLDAGKTLDMAIDSLGNPHIVYEVGDDNSLRYSKNGGAGIILFSGIATNNLSETMNPSIVMDSSDVSWIVSSNPWLPGVVAFSVGLYSTSPSTYTVESGFNAQSTAIAIDQDNHPHFAFVTTNQVRHCERVDSFTTNCTQVSLGLLYPSDIQMVLDRDDEPLFSFRDRSSLSLYYQVGLLSANSTQIDGIGQAGNDVHMVLAADRATVHLLHRDLTHNSLRHLVLRPPPRRTQFDTGVGLPGLGLDLAVSPMGRAHMSYQNFSTKTLRYASSQTGMSPSSPDGSADDTGSDTSIAIDNSGDPYITYPNKTLNNLMIVRVTASPFPWTLVDLGAGPTTLALTSAIAVDGNGWARISYQKSNAEGLWQVSYGGGPPVSAPTLLDNTPSPVGRDSAIAIDPSNGIHVVYPLYSGADGLRLVTPGSSPFAILPAATNPRRPAIAIDSTGLIYVVYYSASNGDLGLVTVNGTTPTASILDSTDDVGEHPDIAIDGQDIPHIVYRDVTNATLKYLRLDGSSLPLTIDSGANTGFEASIAIGPDDVPNVACKVAGPPAAVVYLRGPFQVNKNPVSVTRVQ